MIFVVFKNVNLPLIVIFVKFAVLTSSIMFHPASITTESPSIGTVLFLFVQLLASLQYVIFPRATTSIAALHAPTHYKAFHITFFYIPFIS